MWCYDISCGIILRIRYMLVLCINLGTALIQFGEREREIHIHDYMYIYQAEPVLEKLGELLSRAVCTSELLQTRSSTCALLLETSNNSQSTLY